MKKYTTKSVEETIRLGFEFAKGLDCETFVALYGDLGAGKTAFVKGIVKYFLPDTIVTSPTYNIVNTYIAQNTTLHHYDMYRINDEEDLYSVGFFDNLKNCIVIAEWCENIPFALPEKRVQVTITKDLNDENIRYVEMEYINADSRA